jgi:hypothetical protein
MSGDSPKEWYRYLPAGSTGWSILNEPPLLERLPVTSALSRHRGPCP